MIGAEPLMNVVPLQQKGADQEVVTQFPMGDVEALGLLKMDFLGLRNLDVIDKAVELIGDLDIAAIPMDDTKTYEMLARGEATGVFQFESSGMREALRQVKPTEFEDLIALVALYRPGPDAVHPELRDPQARQGAGHLPRPAAEADPRRDLRHLRLPGAVDGDRQADRRLHARRGRRSPQGDRQEDPRADGVAEGQVHRGRIANDTSDAVARQLWDDMEKAQDYSFNKSHAACYALISYRTAWLRANHPCEYMAALISSVMNTKDRVPFYVNACHELGIEVLPPDVNESQIDFAVVGGKIRFGLNAVKGVGELACRTIIRAREEGGPFESLWDFTERVDPSVVNKRALESLVKCGALPGSRQGMLAVLEQALALRPEAAGRPPRRPGLDLRHDFGAAERDEREAPSADLRRRSSRSPSCCGWRRRRSASTSPSIRSRRCAPSCARRPTRRSPSSSAAATARSVVVGGIVGAVKQLTTKRGEPMVFLRLDDVTGGIDCVVFNSTYAAAAELCVADRILIVKGRVDHKEGETKLVAQEVAAFESVAAKREVRLRIDATRRPAGVDPRPRGADPRLPRREPGARRLRHLAGPQVVYALGAEVPRRAGGRLLRRGEGAPRRVGARLSAPTQPCSASVNEVRKSCCPERYTDVNPFRRLTRIHGDSTTTRGGWQRMSRYRSLSIDRDRGREGRALARRGARAGRVRRADLRHVLAIRTDVDLHRATELVEHGCSPELALRILL